MLNPTIQFKVDRGQPLNQAEMSLIIKAINDRLKELEDSVERLSKNRQTNNRRTRKDVSADSV